MKLTNYRINTVLDSRAEWVREYELIAEDGLKGTGSAPTGETLSHRELRSLEKIVENSPGEASRILNKLRGSTLSQVEFDELLTSSQLDPRDIFALSSAFFDLEFQDRVLAEPTDPGSVRFCLNLLNGGNHAYTNPVRSDFHEFLLVPPANGDCRESIEDYRRINEKIAASLKKYPLIDVAGNLVADVGNGSNFAVIAFLGSLKDGEGLEGYEMMIDASGTDLWVDGGYHLGIADGNNLSPPAFVDYWLKLIELGKIQYLEDPFHENDLESWDRLTREQENCILVGDNFHSGNVAKFTELAGQGLMGAVMLKPDQAHTVSATDQIVDIAKQNGIEVILSHRSISTDSDFLGKYMLANRLKFAKFGNLLSDFSSILKMNHVIREFRD
jgi:enolase